MTEPIMDIQKLHCQVWHRCYLQYPPYDTRLGSMIPPARYPAWLIQHHCLYYLYLHALVTLHQPKKVLALGTQAGGSALSRLLAMPQDSTLITVDSDPTPPVYLGPSLENPRLHRILNEGMERFWYDGVWKQRTEQASGTTRTLIWDGEEYLGEV